MTCCCGPCLSPTGNVCVLATRINNSWFKKWKYICRGQSVQEIKHEKLNYLHRERDLWQTCVMVAECTDHLVVWSAWVVWSWSKSACCMSWSKDNQKFCSALPHSLTCLNYSHPLCVCPDACMFKAASTFPLGLKYILIPHVWRKTE